MSQYEFLRRIHPFYTDKQFCDHVGITMEQYIKDQENWEHEYNKINLIDDRCISDSSDSENCDCYHDKKTYRTFIKYKKISNNCSSSDDEYNLSDIDIDSNLYSPNELKYLRYIHPFYSDIQFCSHVGISIDEYKDVEKKW